MPELPEVENIANFLKKHILNKKISSVSISLSKIVKNSSPAFRNHLKNSRVVNVFRIGKFIIIELSNNYDLIIHLKMSGQILYLLKNSKIKKHTHALIKFKNSKTELRFRDARQFGYMMTIRSDKLDDFLKSKIGPDFFDLTYKDFKKILKPRKRIIKALLLDQKLFAGIGNIYANEALFKAGIHPEDNSSNLSEKNIKKLYKSINLIMKEAVRLGGSSVDDYILPDSSPGFFQNRHKVYQKQGQKCSKCEGIIKRIKQGGRSSFFCPNCQKKHS